MRRTRLRACGLACLLALASASAVAETAPGDGQPATRNGREIYADFRAGLADPTCDTASSAALARPLRCRPVEDGVAGQRRAAAVRLRRRCPARSEPADRIRADPVRGKRLQAGRAQCQRAGRPVADDRGDGPRPPCPDPPGLRRTPVAGGFHASGRALPQDAAWHVRRRLAPGGDGLQRRRVPGVRCAQAQRPGRAQRRSGKTHQPVRHQPGLRAQAACAVMRARPGRRPRRHGCRRSIARCRCCRP